jgi:hypothetical protein
MSKLLAMVATLKAILIAACVAFARGDMLSVILISVLFNLAELGAKPVGQTVPRDSVAVSESNDRGRRFQIQQTTVPMTARSIRLNEADGFVSVLA